MADLILTGHAARKLGRIVALFDPDVEIEIDEMETERDDNVSVYQIAIKDRYRVSVLRGVVIHSTGWSNPSVSRVRHELSEGLTKRA
jgi:hypothetical protein